MSSLKTLKSDLLRLALYAVLALALMPGITLVFSGHVLKTWDSEFMQELAQDLSKSNETPAAREQIMANFRANPPSTICGNNNPEMAKYRARACEPWGNHWQFYWAHTISQAMLLGGLALSAMIALLCLAAQRGRDAQYRSLLLGWRLLSWAGSVEVVLQNAMLAWLSFWLTAWYFHMYSIKLVAIAGIAAACAALVAVVQIFARAKWKFEVEGELVGEKDAPALWQRVRALAGMLGTTAPANIIGGIDTNFFVTESDIALGSESVAGRTLFVSLPLLRILDQREANAVLAHELAHFSGGDTASSAKLGPTLSQFDNYLGAMRGNFLTLVAYYPLALYRTALELGLMRESREREFIADRAAAAAVSGRPLISALIKISAYGNYRGHIERELFQHAVRHDGAIGIAAYVAQGLKPFAWSEQFQDAMQDASVPHPFDSHPKLSERMANVSSPIPAKLFGAVVATQVANSWHSEILTAAQIEGRLWDAYEARFASVHELDLAYRYLPASEEERALVLKHFPPRDFGSIAVAYDGVTVTAGQMAIGWDLIKNMNYEDGYGGDVLTLTIVDPSSGKSSSKKVKLPGIKPMREQLKQALGMYKQRHEVARQG
ncbi:M48 family metallopeptidase [Pseudoduganella violaceinigra]|uniref:M48 family metallopeptidase n=1 Tax=Pseudoduganella violaceinigra TaxID=246602 RepID=UPI000426FF40|nr:M48 family metallopeptidase [Pseudoduganella violaceinigra]